MNVMYNSYLCKYFKSRYFIKNRTHCLNRNYNRRMTAEMDEELNRLVEKYFTKHTFGCPLPLSYQKVLKDVEDLEVYNDDVWVCSYPKAGTTWTQEIVWCICNNVDLEAAKEELDKRYIFLELSAIFQLDDKEFPYSVDMVRNMKRPRFIKTHLPWEMLPKQLTTFERRPKIVHVARNPMDTCVSSYYFFKMLGGYTGDLEVFSKLYLYDKLGFPPFVKTILSYWEQRNELNVLFIKYEDMKKDLSSVIDKVTEFFNVTLMEEDKIKLINHLSFDSMQKNSSVNSSSETDYLQKKNSAFDPNGKFIRSGKSGGFRTELSEERIVQFKTQLLDKLEEAGLTFSI